jgi:hypothetical protein
MSMVQTHRLRTQIHQAAVITTNLLAVPFPAFVGIEVGTPPLPGVLAVAMESELKFQ